MTDFFRFPHVPHIVWLDRGEPRDERCYGMVRPCKKKWRQSWNGNVGSDFWRIIAEDQ